MSTRWRRRIQVLALLSSMGIAILSQGVCRADYVGNKYTDATSGEVLEYNVFVPDGYDPAKKYPLMVVLHAANTNQIPPPRTLASDGKGWAPTFINTPHQTTDPSFFMIPISQTNASGWGEATQPISTPEKFEGRLTIQVLKTDVMTKYSIDPNRLYITGPSMGGRGTWDILRRYPGMFAAAAPAAAPASPTDAALFLNENIWAVCGEVDPIVQGERDTITAIRKLGGNPIYTELAGHGHDSWRSVYPDPQFVPWVFAQHLGVPWWTVSKAPVAPFMGATLTAGWPVTMPPANLPTSFGGGSGTTPGAGTAGAPGAVGNGGTIGAAGGRGTSSGGAGQGGGPGVTASGGATGTGGSAPATGVPSSSTGGDAGPIASGGAPPSSSGGASPPDLTSTGGTGPATQISTGGASGAKDSGGQGGGGCSYAPGGAGRASLIGIFASLGLLTLGRRRRRRR